jgi:hypothetical protein
MDGIKIEVTGNIARVIEKPKRITSGTVGLPVEFSFDSQWDDLKKVAVFRAGDIIRTGFLTDLKRTVPWEVLVNPDAWLSVGVYGTNDDSSITIPTIWANVSPIHPGVTPYGDPSTNPDLPIWGELQSIIENIENQLVTRHSYVTLLASAWTGADRRWSQVVEVAGVTARSQVDLKPNPDQLLIFHEKDLTFVTENDNGVVTVIAIGDRPTHDYTMQVALVEVDV